MYQARKNTRISIVYSSPLSRASRTAEIASGRSTVITDRRLIEVDFGLWEGKTKEEFNKENPTLWKQWINDPETTRAGERGETGGEVVKRVNDFFEEKKVEHAGETIIVVGHNGINRLYMASKFGMPLSNYRKLEQENSSFTLFELDESQGFVLKKLNANTL